MGVLEKDSLNILLKQYEEEIIKTTFISFGLDKLLVNDQYGGDVDTVLNVRKIEHDEFGRVKENSKMQYKNKENERNKISEGKYNGDKFHTDRRYIEKNKLGSQLKKRGVLQDAYTNKVFEQNAKIDLDHIISAHEIHNDAGRALSGIDGVQLANQEYNLTHTNRNLNRSKKAKKMNDFTSKLNEDLKQNTQKLTELKGKPVKTDSDRKQIERMENLITADIEKMNQIDKNAREKYNQEINDRYYKGSKFRKDTLKAAGKKGVSLALKQALGIVLTELILSIKSHIKPLIEKMKINFNIKTLLEEFVEVIKTSYENTKVKCKELLLQFANGFLSGIISSIVTTLINIFASTSKGIGKIIRDVWSSITEVANLLIFNPNNLSFDKLIKTVMRTITIASSIVVGGFVSEYVRQNLQLIPLLSEIVPSFLGGLASGFMSVTLLFFIDNSEIMNRYFTFLESIKSKNQYKIDYYENVLSVLNEYAANLQKINLVKYEEQVKSFHKLTQRYNSSISIDIRSKILMEYITDNKIGLPYDGSIDGLNNFMNDDAMELKFS